MLYVKKDYSIVDKLYFLFDLKEELEDEDRIKRDVEIDGKIITIHWNENECLFCIINDKGEERYYTLEELLSLFYSFIF